MQSDTSIGTSSALPSPTSIIGRPIGITILAIIYFSAALLSVLIIIISLQNATSRPAERIDIIIPGLVIMFLFAGIVCLILGIGLWRLSPIAYWFALVFQVCGFIGTVGLFSLTSAQSMIAPLFSLACAFFLCTRRVRIAFRIGRATPNQA
jgi:hypothetical protein